MAERRVSKPNVEIIQDEVRTTGLDLSVLQRYDPLIKQILITAAHVAMYQFDIENYEWTYVDQKHVEGSLFVVKRDAASWFQFIIVNTCKPGYLVEDILEICEYEVKPPFLMYQNNDKLVRGILFKEPQICKDVCSVLNRILISFGKTSTNLKLSPTKSELDLTSNCRDGSLNSSAAMSELTFEDSFVILNPPTISSAAVSELSSDESLVILDPPSHPTWVHVHRVKESNYAHRDGPPISSAARTSELSSDDSAMIIRSLFHIENSNPSQIKKLTI